MVQSKWVERKIEVPGRKKKSKNRWMKRHCNMGCYKENDLQRNVSHLFECTVIPWRLVPGSPSYTKVHAHSSPTAEPHIQNINLV